MNKHLTKPTTDLKKLINSSTMMEQFRRALPRHLSPDRFARIAITALTRTPKLQQCTPESLMKCLLDLSAAGLEPDGRRAHLIPYGNECTLIIDYKGLVELIRRSGEVVGLRAETVCEFDEFFWINGEITHKVDWRRPRGEVQAVYAEAKMKDGETQTAVMTREEVEEIRKRSRAGNNGPWVSDWSEMAKKTAVRRLSKMLPLSSEVAQNIAADDNQFAPEDRIEAVEVESEAVEEKPISRTEQLKAKAKAAKADAKAPLDELLDLCERDGVRVVEDLIPWIKTNDPASEEFETLTDLSQATLKLVIKSWDQVVEDVKK
jgi:recombination protein RecT